MILINIFRKSVRISFHFLSKMTGSNGASLSESKAKVFTSPVKPGQDKKLYRAIELPNGMKALLVS